MVVETKYVGIEQRRELVLLVSVEEPQLAIGRPSYSQKVETCSLPYESSLLRGPATLSGRSQEVNPGLPAARPIEEVFESWICF